MRRVIMKSFVGNQDCTQRSAYSDTMLAQHHAGHATTRTRSMHRQTSAQVRADLLQVTGLHESAKESSSARGGARAPIPNPPVPRTQSPSRVRVVCYCVCANISFQLGYPFLCHRTAPPRHEPRAGAGGVGEGARRGVSSYGTWRICCACAP